MAHLVTSGMLASSIIFSFGTGSAFADSDGHETDNSAVTTESGAVTEPVENTTVDTEVEQADAPSLVPGDFFYFVKLMAEKVRLAFTFDDYKEAQLLANFAAERIAEANALFAEGKTDEAAELLKEAIATQEQSAERISDSEEPTTEEATVEGEDSKETEGTDTEAKVESKLAHNIDSLVATLSHVKNETAQKALMKNIQKSFAKLEKKAAKLEEKDAKFAKKMKKIKDQVAGEDHSDDQVAGEETSTDQTETDVEASETETETETEPKTAATEEKTEKPAASKGVEKQQAAAKKAEEKKQQATQKAEEKKQQGTQKAEEKKHQDNQKDKEKHQEKDNGNENGNGNGHNGKGNH